MQSEKKIAGIRTRDGSLPMSEWVTSTVDCTGGLSARMTAVAATTTAAAAATREIDAGALSRMLRTRQLEITADSAEMLARTDG